MADMPNAQRYFEIRKQIASLEAEEKDIEDEARAELASSEHRMVTDGRVTVRLKKDPWAAWQEDEFAEAEPSLAEAITVSHVSESMIVEAAAKYGIDEAELGEAMSIQSLDFGMLKDQATELGVPYEWLQEQYRSKGKASLTRDLTSKTAKASEPEMKLYLWAEIGTGKRRPCGGCGDLVRLVDFELDHIHPVSKADTYTGDDINEIDNRQLLCGNCNNVKGNNT